MRVVAFIFFVLLSAPACRVNQGTTSSQTQNKQEGILFLILKIESVGAGDTKITLVNKYWVDGKFKEMARYTQLADGLLEVEFLDDDQNRLKKIFVENPLNTSYETYSETGKIERQQVSLEEAEFTIRTNISKNVSYINVNTLKGNTNVIEL